ncbi:hypothetical protein [Ravibacter arvi]|uniref:hypothetical protein n=1 Tax=Ravibacter arvi TaxID=2051041 RepID=UPI0031ED4872
MRFRVLFLLSIALLVISCGDSEVAAVEKPKINKAELLARLTASERFWRVEYIIEVKGRDSTHLVNPGDTLDPMTWYGYAYQFLDTQVSLEIVSFGLWGKQDHHDQQKVSIGTMYNKEHRGQWFWDETGQTIQLSNVFRHNTLNGYLDTNHPPTCKNAQEAKALGYPERIKFIMYPEGNQNSEISYVYCMRAMWALERLTNGSTHGVPKSFRVLH